MKLYTFLEDVSWKDASYEVSGKARRKARSRRPQISTSDVNKAPESSSECFAAGKYFAEEVYFSFRFSDAPLSSSYPHVLDSVAIRGGTPTIRLTTPLQYTKRRSEDSSWNENDSDALSETMSLPGNAHFDVRRMDKFRGRSFATFGTHQRTSTFGGSSRRSDIWGRRDAVSEAPSDNTSLVGMGRRGVYMKLKGEHVCLFGEKGTRVPNVTVKDITLEVECSLSVCFEFSERYGWQSKEGLKFEIIQLRKEVVGSSIPMPVTLVRTLLNLILPKVRYLQTNRSYDIFLDRGKSVIVCFAERTGTVCSGSRPRNGNGWRDHD